MIIAGTWPLELTVHSQTSHPLDNNTQIQVTTARFHRSTALYRFSDYFDESVDLYAHEHTFPKVRHKAMLLLVHIDSVLCVEASIHLIPAAVRPERAPGPQTRPRRQRLQHTQTHKHIKRCAMRAAMLLTAASSLSTPKSPPSQLPTPLPTIKWKPTKLSAAPALCCPLRLQPPRLNRSRGSMR